MSSARLASYRRDFRCELSYLRQVYSSQKAPRVACITVVAIGLLLVMLAVAVGGIRTIFDTDLSTVFSLRRERSIPESYEYFLAGLIAVLLGVAFFKTRVRAFLFVSVLYGFILVDDSLTYHERVGARLAGALGLPGIGSIRPSDFGEILAWVIAALILVPILIWCLRVRTSIDVGIYLVYGVIMLVLVFFAIGIDVIHAMLRHLQLEKVMGLIEDGGELMVLCGAAACAILYQQGPTREARSEAGDRSIQQM